MTTRWFARNAARLAREAKMLHDKDDTITLARKYRRSLLARHWKRKGWDRKERR